MLSITCLISFKFATLADMAESRWARTNFEHLRAPKQHIHCFHHMYLLQKLFTNLKPACQIRTLRLLRTFYFQMPNSNPCWIDSRRNILLSYISSVHIDLITQECCISNAEEVFMQVLGPIASMLGMVMTSSLNSLELP